MNYTAEDLKGLVLEGHNDGPAISPLKQSQRPQSSDERSRSVKEFNKFEG